MKRKRESFRWRIFIYNIMLLTLITVVCTIYFLLNETTINNYNDTFTSYNELNHVYGNVRDMREAYLQYIETSDEKCFDSIEKHYASAKENLNEVEEHISNRSYMDDFNELNDMLITYHDHLLPVNDTSQELLQNTSHELFLNIMKTRGHYYELVTQDMQSYKDTVNNNRFMLGWMSVLLITFLLLWIIYFSKTMMRLITNPIETIIHNINLVKKGEYDLTQISDTSDEMNVLCLALEDMAESVHKNMEYAQEKAELEKKVLEQENENLKKDEQLAQGELRILQNQINPHFLFNTLNMIYKQAYSEGAVLTSELMEKTSKLLRYSLDNYNKISSLSDELQALENYIFIQEKRFGDRMQFLLQRDEDVRDIRMPTMVLQPLVENAVRHGLKDVMEHGEVVIAAKMDDDAIVLFVSDNGKGMPADELEILILNDYRIYDDEREHVGLYNVIRRLKAFYGDYVKISVNSAEDCGFEIVIRIEGEVDDHVSYPGSRR